MKSHNGIKIFFTIILIAVALAFIFVAITSKEPVHNYSNDVALNAVDENVETVNSKDTTSNTASNWYYSDYKDEVRGNVTKFALLDSSNDINLDFPYKSQKLEMHIRRSKGAYEVYFTIDAQMLCNDFDNDKIVVKFDDTPAKQYLCSRSADGSSGTMFINSTADFVEHLKNSKKTIIEVTYYQNGSQQAVFDTSGFDTSKLK